MTIHEKLFDLKYRKGVSTFSLIRRFPKYKKQIHEVALIGVPEKTLRASVRNPKALDRLLKMKRKLFSSGKAIRKGRKKPWFIWW